MIYHDFRQMTGSNSRRQEEGEDGEHLATDNLLSPHPHCLFKHHNGILSNLPEISDHHLGRVVDLLETFLTKNVTSVFSNPPGPSVCMR